MNNIINTTTNRGWTVGKYYEPVSANLVVDFIFLQHVGQISSVVHQTITNIDYKQLEKHQSENQNKQK